MLAHPARVAGACVLVGAMMLCACGGEDETNDAAREATPDIEPTPAAAPAVQHSYTVRGQVVSVPSPERPIDELRIRHEAIPSYSDREGNVYVNSKGQRGMVSMTMPFPVGEGVSLEGIAPGDIVEFTFVVNWGEESYPVYHVTKIRELPADTTLDFSNASEDG